MNAATGRPPRRRGRYAGPRPSAEPAGSPLAGENLELEVGPVAHGGFCVARHEGQVVFVRHTLPGERVRAVVTEGGSEDRFLRADAVEVLQASADRVEPVCRHAGPGGCGGCDWQHASVEAQRPSRAKSSPSSCAGWPGSTCRSSSSRCRGTWMASGGAHGWSSLSTQAAGRGCGGIAHMK